jgi:hypothetical protein
VSVAICEKINARLRAAGVVVREAGGWKVGGWKSRGNGQTSAYEGGLVHHTATGFGVALPGTGVGKLLINGRPDLRGPLCNYAGNDDGSITVIAAHPANHAGASGGRSMGPLPTTSLFNRRVLGLEIVYPGTVPMKPAQYRSALIWAAVVADVVGGGNIERVRAHAETSVTGKWDPGYAPGHTIDMAAFRRAATTVLEDDDMNLTDKLPPVKMADGKTYTLTVADVLHGLAQQIPGNIGGAGLTAHGPGSYVSRVLAADKILEAVTSDKDIDVDDLADRVVAVQRDLLEAVVRDIVPEEQADQIVLRIAEKLAAQ